MNEQIAAIERENRAFWSRLLREQFDRDVTLEVDWNAFEIDSSESGCLLYPLNIQRAGIERLLYALTGLMNKDEKFKAAATSSIDSIHITSAKDIRAVKLLYHKRRITYRCFAGDWDGYFTIEQAQQYLHDNVPSTSKVRRRVEQWVGGLIAAKKIDADLAHQEPKSAPTDIPESERSEHAPEPIVHDAPAQAHSTEPTITPYDTALRVELEALYNAFLLALEEKNLENLLKLVEITQTDEETLRTELEKDGFTGFSEWILTTYPSLDNANFISLKTKEEDLAGYYMTWLPPYSSDYLNLSQIKFLKTNGEWKIVFRLTEMASAAFQVRSDEEPLMKAFEVLATNPLLALNRPEFSDHLDRPAKEPRLTKRKAQLKRELEEVMATVQDSLEQRDAKAFLSAVAVSQKHGKTLRKGFKRLSKEILENTPDPTAAIFVTLETMGHNTVGYYFVAPHPTNTAFRFVYLRPFARRDGKWKLVFSLEHDLGVSMNVTQSGGDLISRANEVIREIPLLHLDFAMTTLFDDAVRDNPF